jgi:hypothetical protein
MSDYGVSDEVKEIIKQVNVGSRQVRIPFEEKKTAYVDTDKYPQQTEAFEEIIQNMLATYKMKMEDYSPWNMRGTGELGAITRLWDKTARLMNLMGFDIGTGKFSALKDPKNESIDDTLLDLANYAIITMILRKGKWGK